MAATQLKPIPIDVGNSVMLSGGELNYYRYLASSAADAHSNSSNANQQRATLRARSQSRYLNWGNTLDALRARKKLERAKQLEENEKQQQIIDQEEQLYQQAQRRVVLDRANRLLWQETDKVKTLHSGLLLSSVMKEREQQLELKKFKTQQLKVIESSYHDVAEANRLAAIEKERAEELARLQRNQAAAKQQLDQLQVFRLKQLQERADEMAEGERIKSVVREGIAEAEREETQRQKEMKALNMEYFRANQEALAIKAERAAFEAREDDKIAKYASEKERLTQLRKDHEGAKFAAKQARFESMLKRQYDHLMNIKENEKARIERQVWELKEKEDAQAAEKAARAARLAETIKISRAAQIRRKAEEKQRQRELDQTMIEQWKQKNKEMEELEEDADNKAFQHNKTLQATLKEQMVARESRLRNELLREHDEARMMQQAREREDAVFHAYAAQCMEELELRGKSTLPLAKLLKVSP